jgi:hypothetical protein
MEQPFKVRDESRVRVYKAISALPFKKNESGNYTYQDAQIFHKQVVREFGRQYNEFTTNGMEGLTSSDPNNKLLALKSNRAIKWQDVIKTSKAAATAKKLKSGKDEVPDIDNTADAREEADRQNTTRLSAIGCKEGAIDAIKEKIGSAITDSVLQTSDGVDSKSVDDVDIHLLLKTIIDAAERPAAADARTEYVAFCATRFDFRGKLVNAVEQLKIKASKAKGYGVIVQDDVIVLIIMANVEWAARQTWDTGEFKDAKKSIRAKYQASHVHDATSSADIMAILAEADEARDLSRADAPKGMALAVDEGLSFLDALTDGMDRGEAFAVGSDSDSSIEVKSRRSTTRSTRPRRRPSPSTSRSPSRSPSPPPRRRPPRSRSQRGGRRDRDRDDREREEKSTCRHCKAFGRTRAHPNVSESKCNWNKKSKFWRPEWVAKKMGLPYVQRDEFDKAHGGWPDGADSDRS